EGIGRSVADQGKVDSFHGGLFVGDVQASGLACQRFFYRNETQENTSPHTGTSITSPTATRGQYGSTITSTIPASDIAPNQATGPMAQPQAPAHSNRLPSSDDQPNPRRARRSPRGHGLCQTCL